jgi:hypothetical protein
MQIRFEFSASYHDLMAYSVHGDADLYGVEAYANTPHGIEYMRETFNHCGDPTSFDRNILSRQGGAVVHSRTKSPSRWTPQLYATFVDWLYTKHAASRLKWVETCKRNGWGDEELAQFDPMRPVPRAMYWSQESSRYLVEPWWTPEAALQAR